MYAPLASCLGGGGACHFRGYQSGGAVAARRHLWLWCAAELDLDWRVGIDLDLGGSKDYCVSPPSATETYA
jgi:hypothetical protein